jgi:acyl-homoserine-lactone acylase
VLLLFTAATADAASTRVSVIRDRAGIPHIKADDFRRLGYGEAWAFAGDNLCTLAEQFVTVNGERSRFFGPDQRAVNYSAGVFDPNLKSDFYYKYVKKSGIVDQTVRQKPPVGPLPEIRQLYKGFVEGYNRYLDSGKLNDPRCKGKPWIRHITLRDMYLRGEQIATAGASAQFISNQVDAAPPAATPKSSMPDLGALKKSFDTSDAASGSNAIGLGNQATRNKTGMVLANPHFPWRGSERFWMAHLTVPGKYDALGGTLEGFPLVGIGFNRHLAWTHTVSQVRRFTLFQLKLVPGDPTSYVVDGKNFKMGRVTVSVQTPTGPQQHTFYTTRYGVVFQLPQANFFWTNDTAYALGDSVKTDLSRSANQFLRMGQSNTVQSFLNAQKTYLATPTFTSTVADDRGFTAFSELGNAPNVTQQKIDTCIPDGLPRLVFSSARVVTLDGSRGACNWGNDPGTPVKGIFGPSHLPFLVRRDYVENSNDSYWLANPNHPMAGFSPIVGLTNVAQNLRTRLGNEMIQQRLAGSDGYGKPKFDIPTMRRMWQNDRSKLAELVLSDLVAGCRTHTMTTASNGELVNIGPACEALALYNKTGNLDARGGWLFSEWNRFAPGAGFFKDTFDPSHPLTTPSKLNTDNQAIYRAIADAVLELKAHGVALDTPYGGVQITPRRGRRIPIHGCNTGCFNTINASNGLSTSPVNQAAYGQVYSGSSLVMFTELRKRGPRSQGILTYSQATNRRSRFYSNMTRLYSQKKWVNIAFTAGAIARNALSRTTLNVR